MMNNLELLVVIINYKTPQLVIDCIESTLPQLRATMRIAVIDNCSGDGSSDIITQWIASNAQDKIDFIQSETNSGFSGGNNQGISLHQAEFYLLTNSDTVLRAGAIETLLETAQRHPRGGLFSPRLEWPDGTPQISCFRFHSPISEFINTASTSFVTRTLARWNVPCEVSAVESTPEWTSFACVMVRAQVFQQIGLMDEGYFLYYEDVDFSREAHYAGWSVVNNPDAHVVHLRGGSSDVKKNIAQKARLARYVYASRTRYFCKHYGYSGLLVANILWTLGACLSQILLFLGKKENPICEHAFTDIWINFFSAMKPFEVKK